MDDAAKVAPAPGYRFIKCTYYPPQTCRILASETGVHMAKFKHSVTIDRPVSEVFQYITNVENLPEWAEVIQSVRVTTPDAVDVGTEAEVEVELYSRRVVATYRVTEYERDRIFAFETADAPFDLYSVYTFTPIKDGTWLHVTSTGKARGISRFIEGSVARLLDRQFIADHERLKHILEENHTA